MSAFPLNIFEKDKVVEKIIESFEDGSKTLFILNTLLLTQITLWTNKQLGELIELFEHFVSEKFEDNRLSASSNPLMVLALSSELLNRIGNERMRFKGECAELKE